jgi:glyoxylase-like metal-dependent hydrolase (beta-lactamase superfamily II)/ferredoxin
MARVAQRLAGNAPGDLYVDEGCIDCDTCRTLAPEVFGDGDGTALVRRQPRDAGEHQRARMALVSCPTAAIGSLSKVDVRAAARALPAPIPTLPDVFFCGYASQDSYGATSYLIRRASGNVLVDSPRAARPLLERIEELGGVSLMFLTHRDDVADHQVFRRRFGCRRILHADDVGPGTRDVELQPRGRAPVRLADDLLIIPVPGHTRGSAALLYRDEALFTGDHLWWEDGRGLHASRGVCWWSWPEQLRSLALLHDFRFRAVLPGHGGRYLARDAGEMRAALTRLAPPVSGERPS